jgi:hypothetical protein
MAAALAINRVRKRNAGIFLGEIFPLGALGDFLM